MKRLMLCSFFSKLGLTFAAACFLGGLCGSAFAAKGSGATLSDSAWDIVIDDVSSRPDGLATGQYTFTSETGGRRSRTNVCFGTLVEIPGSRNAGAIAFSETLTSGRCIAGCQLNLFNGLNSYQEICRGKIALAGNFTTVEGVQDLLTSATRSLPAPPPASMARQAPATGAIAQPTETARLEQSDMNVIAPSALPPQPVASQANAQGMSYTEYMRLRRIAQLEAEKREREPHTPEEAKLAQWVTESARRVGVSEASFCRYHECRYPRQIAEAKAREEAATAKKEALEQEAERAAKARVAKLSPLALRLDGIVEDYARAWAWNRYEKGSVTNVTSSRSGAELKLRGDFRYAAGDDGGVTVTFENSKITCVEFADRPGQCAETLAEKRRAQIAACGANAEAAARDARRQSLSHGGLGLQSADYSGCR